ncbi:hypothetical protein BCIN_05g00890 [Botrytis cinerea B05.10]|uniref:Uncharacterized protein n=1 Tax=Botryotinia fuckeliana (strain B05.10) TaxID=332648 RepID=A0A384JGD1_BOTFB|nr:hypothetical protein BCIN_05g00890 [Botrytis cinerea B05.10]ATZ49669.1 hypothetical protein BCIN_05g00890 [Botrytis cinerea B05.10]
MNYDEFPTENGALPATVRRKTSPMSFMANKLRELKRPGRLRSRVFFSLIFTSSIILIALGKWHAYKTQHSASYLSSYVPEKLTGTFAPYTIIESSKWDDTIPLPNNETNANTDTTPRFHLLILARKKSLNLCKTLLTASILNYPPPTLLGFKLESEDKVEEKETSTLQEIQNTLDFLNGKEMHDEDLVLLLNANTWLQLPAEILIGRFLRYRREANAKLREEYGVERGYTTGTGTVGEVGPQKYTQKVLFAARKDCAMSGERGDAGEEESCYEDVIPQSSLLGIRAGKIDQYGENLRFIESSLAMGKVRDVKAVWSRAWEIAQERDGGGKGKERYLMQEIVAQVFGEQEGGRVEKRRTEEWRWTGWLERILGVEMGGKGRGRGELRNGNANANRTAGVGGNSERGDGEFGIGLDYTSEIFHTVGKSGDELKVMKIGEKESRKQEVVRRRGVINGSVEEMAILSADLENIPGPLDLCRVSDMGIDIDRNIEREEEREKEKEIGQSVNNLKAARERNISWDSIPLFTYRDGGPGGLNSRVPSSLSFSLDLDLDYGPGDKDIDREKEKSRKEEETWRQKIWGKTWWRKWGKPLWEECAKGEEEQKWEVRGEEGEGGIWRDGRGGRGGVWTGERVWVEWGEVCGGEEMEEEVFGI